MGTTCSVIFSVDDRLTESKEREIERERDEEEGKRTGAEIADLPIVTLLQRMTDKVPCVCHTATNLLCEIVCCLHHSAWGL